MIFVAACGGPEPARLADLADPSTGLQVDGSYTTRYRLDLSGGADVDEIVAPLQDLPARLFSALRSRPNSDPTTIARAIGAAAAGWREDLVAALASAGAMLAGVEVEGMMTISTDSAGWVASERWWSISVELPATCPADHLRGAPVACERYVSNFDGALVTPASASISGTSLELKGRLVRLDAPRWVQGAFDAAALHASSGRVSELSSAIAASLDCSRVGAVLGVDALVICERAVDDTRAAVGERIAAMGQAWAVVRLDQRGHPTDEDGDGRADRLTEPDFAESVIGRTEGARRPTLTGSWTSSGF